MSRTRHQQPVERETPANASRTLASSESSPDSLRTQDWIWMCFIVGVWIAYAWIFHGSIEERQFIWNYLTIPDAIVEYWVGQDFARFSVLDRIPIVLSTGLILGVAYLIGRCVLILLAVDSRINLLERITFASAIGLNAESLFVLAIGLMGQLRNIWIYLGAVVALVILSLVCRRAPGHCCATKVENQSLRQQGIHWLCMAAPFVFCCILGGMLPPWQFDVREYHLQVPKEWFQAGRISFLPHNVYGNMPLGAELHGVIGMAMFPGPLDWWWGSLVGKTLISCYGPLTGLALLSAGWRFVNLRAGVVAAIVYVSLPWIVHESMAGLIECAVAFYGFSAVYALMIWQADLFCESSCRVAEAADGKPGNWVIVAGFLAGASAACKYPSVLFVVATLFVFVLLVAIRKRTWRAPFMYGACVMLGCGLWYAKNFAFTGNPTYPLLYSVFGGQTRTPESDEQWRQAHQVPGDNQGKTHTWAQLVDAIRLAGWKSVFLSPALWPLCVGLIVSWRRHRNVVLVLASLFLFNFVGWWLVTHRIDRFLVPAYVYVAFLGGIGAVAFSNQSWLWNRSLFVFLSFSCLSSFLLINCRVAQEAGDIRFFVGLDELRIDAPTEADPIFYRTHPARRFINQHVRDGSAVLLVGDAQAFDIEIPTFYNTCFDPNIFEQLMSGKSSHERRENLRKLGISHIFFYWREMERYRSPGNYGYTAYVTKDLVRRELATEQGLLRLVPTEDNPDNSELYQVVYP